jgi:hypothetical protein
MELHDNGMVSLWYTCDVIYHQSCRFWDSSSFYLMLDKVLDIACSRIETIDDNHVVFNMEEIF